MNTRRRLALLCAAFPFAFIVYACSDDTSDTPGEGEDGGTGSEGGNDIDSSTPGKDSSLNLPDTSTNPDASDGAVPIACVGNPLTADGGTTDGGVTLDGGVTTSIVTGGTFLDGPQWVDALGGFLVYSEFETTTPQLRRVAADGGAAAAFRTAGFTNQLGPVGNAVRNGFVVSAVDTKNAGGASLFFVTAPDGGAGAPIATTAAATSPNDLVVGPGNNLYFTDGQYQGPAGTSGLYRIFTDGGVAPLQQSFGRANGIAISPDNTKLYVGIGVLNGDPVGDKIGVLVYNVAPNGNVTTPGTSFLTDTDLVDVPDGMAVDVGGNLWIAEAAADGAPGGRVEVFSPAKKRLGTIPFAAPQRPTGVAFGGPDSKTLFITTETGVFTYKSRCAGVR